MIPPDPQVARLQKDVMGSLLNEDHLGLWEIAWMLDVSPGQEQADVDAKVTLAQVAAYDLLERGAVEVWELDGWPPAGARQLTMKEFSAVAEEVAVWIRPEDATRLIQVRATET